MGARLGGMLEEIRAERHWPVVAKEAMPDHVQDFVWVAPTGSPSDVARQLEGANSAIVREEFPWLGHLKALWSTSSFVAGVGDVSESTDRRTIENQWAAA